VIDGVVSARGNLIIEHNVLLKLQKTEMEATLGRIKRWKA